MSFRKPCRMPFRKLIRPFTLTAQISGSLIFEAVPLTSTLTRWATSPFNCYKYATLLRDKLSEKLARIT